MNEILLDLYSPRWWFSLLLGSLVLAIFSSVVAVYISRYLDRNAFRVLAVIRNLSPYRSERFKERAALLRGDVDLKYVFALREHRYRMTACGGLIFAAASALPLLARDQTFITEELWLFGLSTVAGLLHACANFFSSVKVAELVEAATPRLSDLHM